MPPPRFPSPVLLATASLAAFALGWFCRPLGNPPASAAVPMAAKHPVPGPAAANTTTADAEQAFDAVLADPADDYHRRLRLAQATAGLDRAGTVDALEHEHARNRPDGPARTLPTEALLAHYAELDPAAAALWLVQTYPLDKIVEDWLGVTLGTWMSVDPKSALAWGRGLPAGDLRVRVYGDLLDLLSDTDPAAAARTIIAEGDHSPLALAGVFTKLAEKDLGAACELARHLAPDSMQGAVDGIIQAWARRQPTAAHAWAMQIPPGSLRDSAMQQFYTTWGEQDPAAAAAWLNAQARPELGRYADQIAGDWAKRDLASARAWSETLPAQVRTGAILAVVSAWGQDDPRAATEYAMTRPENERMNLVTTPVSQWAKVDRGAALAWTEQQTIPDIQGTALSVICGTWCTEDPRACVDYLAKRGNDDATHNALSAAFQTWASSSPEEVWQWGQSAPDAKQRGEAESAALEVLAESDPAAASARLGQLPADAQAQTARQLADRWAGIDPAAAARWASTISDGEARTDAAKAVVMDWTQYDAPAATAWVGSLPTGDLRDAGISALLVGKLPEISPDAAVRLVQSMQDPDQRKEMLYGTVTTWNEQDPAKAQAWVAQAQDFTADEREQLLAKLSEAAAEAKPSH